ncbi:MAG: amino acid ABC transporter permease [Anaerolineae bacterium]|nr:amino acid ABC transporter permease [Anaerolineae bacterium]MDW8099632.1 amino acid ABC transporter permease [Anaerolineae bacterium]
MVSEASEPDGSVGTTLKARSRGLVQPLWRARLDLARIPWWAVIVAIIGLYVGLGILASPRYREVFRFIIPGLRVTLQATFAAYGLALVIGLVVGLMRVSRNPVLYALSTLYVEIIRGIPMLVILLYAGFVISPRLRDTTAGAITLSDLQEAILGLAIGYGAYLAEVYRAGIESIHRGQMEAARSLGMTYMQAMRYVVLPQAIRVILPPLGNDFIAMLKDSSLVAVLAIPDLLQMGRLYISRTFRAFEGYNSVALLYLAMTLLLSLLVRWIERRWSLHGR